MSQITPIPIGVYCTKCDEDLLFGHVNVESDEDIERSWVIIDEINIQCPKCKSIITSAIDDITKLLTSINT